MELKLQKFFDCRYINVFYRQTLDSPLFFRKIIKIERFALRATILHECQNYLGGGGGLEGSEKKNFLAPPPTSHNPRRPSLGTCENQDSRDRKTRYI